MPSGRIIVTGMNGSINSQHKYGHIPLIFPINLLSTQLHEKQKVQHVPLEVASLPHKLSQSPGDRPSPNKNESSQTPGREGLESVAFTAATDSLLQMVSTTGSHHRTVSLLKALPTQLLGYRRMPKPGPDPRPEALCRAPKV